jgi:hypothetical protein
MSSGELLFALVSWLVFPLIVQRCGLDEDPDYREELEKGGAWHLARAWLHLLPVFSLALLVQYWLRQLTGSETDHARQLFHSVAFAIVYLVLVLVFIPVVRRLKRAYGRARTETLVSVVFFAGFLLPSWLQETSNARATATREASVRTLIDLLISLRTQWIADIRTSGAHDVPGITPPMILVERHEGRVEVSNVAGRDICLRMEAVSSPDAKGVVHNRCRFREYSSTNGCLILRTSSSQAFHSKCGTMELEFRVGDFEHPEVGWWSDSALIELEEDIGQLRANLSITDFREWSDARVQEEIARLTSLRADTERPARWRDDVDFWSRLR